MDHICIGMLAHVDAGKTTLSESILYLTGAIRKMGRVDHQDAFLDTDAMERARGITIFSKQAEFVLRRGGDEKAVTLLDTPGHVDFSAEMERTLSVLDYAVLVISGADGVQGHTVTLWRLLEQYHVPVFLFINKMDQAGADREKLMQELKRDLSDACIDFGADPAVLHEDLAMYDEQMMERFLSGALLQPEEISMLIRKRQVFPCFFGSALKVFGVEELLDALCLYTRMPKYPAEFAAKVYKITRDARGQRLTHMKITGGTLAAREDISTEEWTEKVNQILIPSGSGAAQVDSVSAGQVCAVTGLTQTYAGQGLGLEEDAIRPMLEPVLTYQIRILLDGTGHIADAHTMLLRFKELEEEDPQLHIVWNEELQEIHAQLMGEIEIEVLKNRIYERFGVPVDFGSGRLVYKETIAAPVEGVGHFEPLRHYAEVHLLLEPLPRGSGLQFESRCSEDVLARNWQRLILTHLQEKQHRGVLTGSAVTDMRISLINGRAHLKHTEGGDFRQATYRAVRQGLMKAQSILLEPVYAFRLEIPAENVGRALSDVQKMFGEVTDQETLGDRAILTGKAPVSCLREYQKEVTAYSRGSGRIFCSLAGYMNCHNTEEVLAERRYDPDQDLADPTGSVFCAHGAGFLVPWDQVEDYMHLEALGVDVFHPEEEDTAARLNARR
ncbi:MAG: TetM/TetW/TetO/TetS family tetracycline resistance ribosomal protection protein, partial [Firmicutes bacterium]|nr:TetM/TetW/TetO/TetS family tetracycline resistance ribosomal protection protein [Bacillota bacterium]